MSTHVFPRYYGSHASDCSYRICGVYVLHHSFPLSLQLGGRRTAAGFCKVRGVGSSQIFEPFPDEVPAFENTIWHHVEVEEHKEKPLVEVLLNGRLWCVRQPQSVCAHIKNGDWRELLICFSMAAVYNREPFTASICPGYIKRDWLELASHLDAEKERQN
eukprot:722859-Amphidinium_carterae.1